MRSIGGRMQAGQTTVDLEVIGFYRKVSNLIVDTDDGTGSGNTITANSTNAVRVHGLSLVGSASLTSAVAATLGYTYTTSEQGNSAGGRLQLTAGPALESRELHRSICIPPATPVGGTLSVFWVGEIFDNVSSFGRVPSGNYAVVDLAGRYFLDCTAATSHQPATGESLQRDVCDRARPGFPRHRWHAVSHEHAGRAAHAPRLVHVSVLASGFAGIRRLRAVRSSRSPRFAARPGGRRSTDICLGSTRVE